MAFTELNFVPGEVVTAAKMNLLAANDVWLRDRTVPPKIEMWYLNHSKAIKAAELTEYSNFRVVLFKKTIPKELDGKTALLFFSIRPFQLPKYGKPIVSWGGIIATNRMDHSKEDFWSGSNSPSCERYNDGEKHENGQVGGAVAMELFEGQEIKLCFDIAKLNEDIHFATTWLQAVIF